MRCDEVRAWLRRDLDGAAEPAAEVVAHLERCAACEHEAARLRRISEAARTVLPGADIPFDFRGRVLAALPATVDDELADAARPRVLQRLLLAGAILALPLLTFFATRPASHETTGELLLWDQGRWVRTKRAPAGTLVGLLAEGDAKVGALRMKALEPSLLRGGPTTQFEGGFLLLECDEPMRVQTPLAEIQLEENSRVLALLVPEEGEKMLKLSEWRRATPAALCLTVFAGGAVVANAEEEKKADAEKERVVVVADETPRHLKEILERLKKLEDQLEKVNGVKVANVDLNRAAAQRALALRVEEDAQRRFARVVLRDAVAQKKFAEVQARLEKDLAANTDRAEALAVEMKRLEAELADAGEATEAQNARMAFLRGAYAKARAELARARAELAKAKTDANAKAKWPVAGGRAGGFRADNPFVAGQFRGWGRKKGKKKEPPAHLHPDKIEKLMEKAAEGDKDAREQARRLLVEMWETLKKGTVADQDQLRRTQIENARLRTQLAQLRGRRGNRVGGLLPERRAVTVNALDPLKKRKEKGVDLTGDGKDDIVAVTNNGKTWILRKSDGAALMVFPTPDPDKRAVQLKGPAKLHFLPGGTLLANREGRWEVQTPTGWKLVDLKAKPILQKDERARLRARIAQLEEQLKRLQGGKMPDFKLDKVEEKAIDEAVAVGRKDQIARWEALVRRTKRLHRQYEKVARKLQALDKGVKFPTLPKERERIDKRVKAAIHPGNRKDVKPGLKTLTVLIEELAVRINSAERNIEIHKKNESSGTEEAGGTIR